MFFLPRIGQEVIVEFYNGDPDKPIVIGSVYNGEYLPPYELPVNKTQSGIKTRSSVEAGVEEANELRFEDKKGNEEIYLHAQRDYRREIEHCETAIIINGDHEMQVKSGKSLLEASESIEFKVGENSIVLTKEKILLQGKAIFLNDS